MKGNEPKLNRRVPFTFFTFIMSGLERIKNQFMDKTGHNKTPRLGKGGVLGGVVRLQCDLSTGGVYPTTPA
jgi:hypothetical protein